MEHVRVSICMLIFPLVRDQHFLKVALRPDLLSFSSNRIGKKGCEHLCSSQKSVFAKGLRVLDLRFVLPDAKKHFVNWIYYFVYTAQNYVALNFLAECMKNIMAL